MATIGRPNVLIFHVDEQPWNTLTCYGNRFARTTNIDRLASQGCRFVQCFSQSFDPAESCLSLLSGQYPSRPCALNRALLPRVLKQYGYHSSAFGALALASAEDPLGFDQAEIFQGFGHEDAYSAYLKIYAPEAMTAITRALSTGRHDPLPPEHTCNAFAMSRALAVMHQHAHVRQPFFCMLGLRAFEMPLVAPQQFYGVHDPDVLPLPRHQANRDKTEKPRAREHNYYACITEIDSIVGSVLQELERMQLAHNTLVIYTASRGRDADSALYSDASVLADTMMHVPLLVRGPAESVHSDKASAGVIELVDVAPTILELAGIQVPPAMQGQSFRPILAGEAQEHRESAIAELPAARVLRSANFSYVARGDGTESMYDLTKPATQHLEVGGDLRYRGVIAEHRRQLLARMIDSAAKGACLSGGC